MSGCCLVTTSLSSEAAAVELAGTIVSEHLAACVQVVGPVRSSYRWKDRVESATEWLCLAKTTESRRQALFDRIRTLHGYEVPEIIALPIASGDADYLEWIRRQTAA